MKEISLPPLAPPLRHPLHRARRISPSNIAYLKKRTNGTCMDGQSQAGGDGSVVHEVVQTVRSNERRKGGIHK